MWSGRPPMRADGALWGRPIRLSRRTPSRNGSRRGQPWNPVPARSAVAAGVSSWSGWEIRSGSILAGSPATGSAGIARAGRMLGSRGVAIALPSNDNGRSGYGVTATRPDRRAPTRRSSGRPPSGRSSRPGGGTGSSSSSEPRAARCAQLRQTASQGRTGARPGLRRGRDGGRGDARRHGDLHQACRQRAQVHRGGQRTFGLGRHIMRGGRSRRSGAG